jgi:hypothetical protein
VTVNIFKAVLLLLRQFAPVHEQDKQIRRAANRVLPVALLPLEQYHNIILMLQKQSKIQNPQSHSIKEDQPQNISWGLQIISIFLIPQSQLK